MNGRYYSLGLSEVPRIANILAITEVAFSARLEKPRFIYMSKSCWNKLVLLKDNPLVLEQPGRQQQS